VNGDLFRVHTMPVHSDDTVDPDVEAHVDQLVQERYADLERWTNLVAAAVDQNADTVVYVRCCTRDPAGWVRRTDLGLLLITTTPTGGFIDDEEVGAAGWRRRTGQRLRRFVGVPLEQPHRYQDLHGWRPADPDQVPHVHCTRHGHVPVGDDVVAKLVAAARSGRRATVTVRPTQD